MSIPNSPRDSPSFMVRAVVFTLDAVGVKILIRVITAIVRNIDVVVTWVRKHLVDASIARGFVFFFIIVGIMASIFTSKSIQVSSQWELVITAMLPEIMVVRIMIKMMGFY